MPRSPNTKLPYLKFSALARFHQYLTHFPDWRVHPANASAALTTPSTLPALGLRLSLLPTPHPNPDHEEDDNNDDRQNYADRGTAGDRGTVPEGVMVGEGRGGEHRHQGSGRGERDDQGNGKVPAHGVMVPPRHEQTKTR